MLYLSYLFYIYSTIGTIFLEVYSFNNKKTPFSYQHITQNNFDYIQFGKAILVPKAPRTMPSSALA